MWISDSLSTWWFGSSGIRARPKTLLHPAWLQTKLPIGKTATPRQRGCSPRPTQAATAENDWSDSSACEYTSPLITVEGPSSPTSTRASVSGKLHSWNEYFTEYSKQKPCYLRSLKMTFSSQQSADHISHSVPLNLFLVSNHEDEDNLPEALAAISSQSMAKSGSSSSLDKQIQPSIYPQVIHALTRAHALTKKMKNGCLFSALHSSYGGLLQPLSLIWE